MRRALARGSLSLAVALAACSASDDPLSLPTSHAERARGLKLQVVPPLRVQSREEFGADAQKDASETTDDDVQRQHDGYGRLGFYPASFDLRGGGAAASDLYVAYYSSETKAVTVVGTPDHSTLVHELVHALQDQYFDLKRVHGEHLSSDESLARSALIEGDARMAEYRDYLWDDAQDPIAVLRTFATVAGARSDAAKIFRETKLPLIFASHAAFAYSFGAAFVADELFLPSRQWDYKRLDARFAAGDSPVSTQQIILAGAPPDPIVETGLARLPGTIAAEWAVENVDRMGEWYTYVLLFPVSESATLPTVTGPNVTVDLAKLTAAWDGDQLVVLRKKDGSEPPSAKSPSGIVWTTAWDDADAASTFANQLKRLHGAAVRADDVPSSLTAADGEEIWLEQRESQVCFVKNFPAAMAAELAHAALYTAEERRFEVLRRPVSRPAIVH